MGFSSAAFFILRVQTEGAFELVIYLAACAFIVWGADSYRRLVRQHRDLTVRLLGMSRSLAKLSLKSWRTV